MLKKIIHTHTHIYTHIYTHTHTYIYVTYTHTYIYMCVCVYVCFPGGSVVKNPPANSGDAGDTGSIPGSGRSPGERNGNPLQYSCLGNPMDRGACWATVHCVAKIQTRFCDLTITQAEIKKKNLHRVNLIYCFNMLCHNSW